MKILAIDTSCDDTSVAVCDGLNVLSSIFWSKIKTHERWGGVVPHEARRQHEEFLMPAITEALEVSGLSYESLDAVAVTYGPGLAIALEPGIAKAKEIAKKYSKKLIGVNHMIGHVYSVLSRDTNGIPYSNLRDFDFPLIAVTVSGGHTDMYEMPSHMEFRHIGWTLDDALGEAYDKVGRMCGLGFPAGPKIDERAKLGNASAYSLPRPLWDSPDYNWSYSGLKTAVLYEIKRLTGEYAVKPGKKVLRAKDDSSALTESQINDMCASFQEAALSSLLRKVKQAVEVKKPKMLVVGGGVIANSELRTRLEAMSKEVGIPFFYPVPLWLCTDNAAMIGVSAHFYAEKGLFVDDIDSLDREPSLRI